MRFTKVNIEAIGYELAVPIVVTSLSLEERLAALQTPVSSSPDSSKP